MSTKGSMQYMTRVEPHLQSQNLTIKREEVEAVKQFEGATLKRKKSQSGDICFVETNVKQQ